MNPKKVLKRTALVVILLITTISVTPYLFKDKIQDLLTETINKQLRAKVSFSAVDLSLLRDFPKVRATIHDFTIINEAPFQGDTLFYSLRIQANMSLGELFKKKSESMQITSISAINSVLNIRTNEKGDRNFDIVKNTEATDLAPIEDSPISLSIQEYEIQNLQCSYQDNNAHIAIKLSNLNHSGKGDFSADNLEANTKTSSFVSLQIDGNNYLENMAISLDAVFGIDFKKNSYTFHDNTAMINQLPLKFKGVLQLLENEQRIDLNFKTPSSSFKNMLAVIPEKYTGTLEEIKTSGNFHVNGRINGILNKEKIPKFKIAFEATKGMFQYTSLPEAVKNIEINTELSNTTGDLNDTEIKVNKLAFTIDQNTFETQGKIYHNIQHPKVSLTAKGSIDLGNIAKVYPYSSATTIKGVLHTGLSSTFDMESILQEKYETIENKGFLKLENFSFNNASIANPFHIKKMGLSFDTNTIKLSEFDANSGTSDMYITGNLDNFYGYVFNNKTLKGDFIMKSDQLNISDFMFKKTETIEDTTDAKEASIAIPNFLNCSITAAAKQVKYDELTLSNVSGILTIKNQVATLKKLQMELFDGKVDLNGFVSTKNTPPIFETQLKFKGLNITDSFSQIDLLANIAPIGGVVEGKLNSSMNLSGRLTKNMTPDVASISGNLLGELLDSKVTTKKSKLLSSLSSDMKFIDISQLNLKDVKAFLSFENGQVKVQPFVLQYQDIAVEVSGSHGFNQQMNYQLQFEVPAKYFGTEVSKYLTKFSEKETVPVAASVAGTFANPLISTDMQKAGANLLKSLIKQEKEALVNKGTSALKNIFNGNRKQQDSSTASKATNLLKGLFKKKKKNNK